MRQFLSAHFFFTCVQGTTEEKKKHLKTIKIIFEVQLINFDVRNKNSLETVRKRGKVLFSNKEIDLIVVKSEKCSS